MDSGAAALKHSIAGRMGTAMEKVTRYAGFDWQTNIALLGGFAAKEVVVSTLGTAYSLGEVDPEDSTSLARRLRTADGWSPVTAFSLILFTIFYSPCFVAVVCIVKESGSWKWGLFSMVFNTVLALSCPFCFTRPPPGWCLRKRDFQESSGKMPRRFPSFKFTSPCSQIRR